MARDSKRARQLRKLRRERSVAYRMVDVAVAERDQWRALASSQHDQLSALHDIALAAEHAATKDAIEPAFTMTTIPEEADGEDNPLDRPNTNDDGLEVSTS